jgi:hypothetical protein
MPWKSFFVQGAAARVLAAASPLGRRHRGREEDGDSHKKPRDGTTESRGAELDLETWRADALWRAHANNVGPRKARSRNVRSESVARLYLSHSCPAPGQPPSGSGEELEGAAGNDAPLAAEFLDEHADSGTRAADGEALRRGAPASCAPLPSSPHTTWRRKLRRLRPFSEASRLPRFLSLSLSLLSRGSASLGARGGYVGKVVKGAPAPRLSGGNCAGGVGGVSGGARIFIHR